ncbi:lysine transporter LysE [Rhodococcus rhodochrous]|nr:lysine transporter LysE [Rhodococcus rhodochrous]
MVSASAAAGVAVVALGMVLTPGPNMMYLTSRSLAQGRRAGLVSLAGVGTGFLCYLLAAAAGLSALFAAVPVAYDLLRFAGAGYLAYLAWGILRPGGGALFAPAPATEHSAARLFGMGLATNVLNPKIALMYAALLPQFVSPAAGPEWRQFLVLGAVQIGVALTVNGLIVLGAAAVARRVATHPRAVRTQRLVTGTALGAFAVATACSQAPPARA